MVDLNKNKGFLIALGGAAVLLIIGLVLWRGAVSAAQEEAGDIESANSQYKAISKKYNGAPTKQLVDEYKQKLEELNKIGDEMVNVAPKGKLPVFNPSSIKVAIRDTKDHFVDVSSEKNVRIPEDIGWAEYLGPNVPKSSDIPKLTRQFVIIKDVLDILCSDDANVEEVKTIDRNPSGAASDEDDMDEEVTFDDGPSPRSSKKSKKEKEELYDAVPVEFEFTTTPASFYTILAKLRNKGFFYRIERLTDKVDIQSIGEANDPSSITEALVVQMLVDNIQLNVKKEE